MTAPLFQDRQMLEDAALCQQAVAEGYCRGVGDCSSPVLLGELLGLLQEEQQIRRELLQELEKRGWLPAPSAGPEQVRRVYERFEGVGGV